MRQKPLGLRETVRIRPEVKEHGGKLGTVVYEGREHGWYVVKVKFDIGRDEPEAIAKMLVEMVMESPWLLSDLLTGPEPESRKSLEISPGTSGSWEDSLRLTLLSWRFRPRVGPC